MHRVLFSILLFLALLPAAQATGGGACLGDAAAVIHQERDFRLAVRVQYDALTSGVFDYKAQTPAAHFLRKYWSPKSGLEGAVERDGKLVVLVSAAKLGEAFAVLPLKIDGLEVEVRSAAFEQKPLKNGLAKNGEYYPNQPVVLITGSGAGIGLAVAKEMLRKGYRVVMTARKNTAAALRASGFADSDQLLVRELDVTNAEQQKALVAEISEKWGGVDWLVNNAGKVVQGAGEQLAASDLQDSMNTNFIGAAGLAREVLPMMRFKGRGRILNVSSMTAEVPSPLMGAYAASKAALNAYMTTFAGEVAPAGVKVSTMEIGFVDSDAHEKIVMTALAEAGHNDPQNPYYQTYQKLEHSMNVGRMASTATPETVAVDVAQVFESSNPPLYTRNTIDSVALNLAKRLLPTPLFTKFTDLLLSSAAKIDQGLQLISPAKEPEPLAPGVPAEKPPSAMQRTIATIRYFVDSQTENFSGKTVAHLREQGGSTMHKIASVFNKAPEFSLSFGERYGRGLAGAVYKVDDVEGNPMLEGAMQKWGGLVVKTPHYIKGTNGSLQFPQSVILAGKELDIYRTVSSQLPQIEQAPSFPKNADWAPGTMPVVPIVATLQTRIGNLIFKPTVKGVSFAELHRRYGTSFPEEMSRSLRSIYDFAQALFERSKVAGVTPADPSPLRIGRSLYPDLNPSNLVWIEDPVELKRLGMSQPGFRLYELGEFINKHYSEKNTSFEDFKEEFKDAVVQEAEPE